MKNAGFLLLGLTLAQFSAACGGGAAAVDTSGGAATASIEGTTFASGDVRLTFEPGESGYFRIEGTDAKHPEDDCLPGLGGGLALYGSVPEGVTALEDLSGRELPIEFSGDGDDFNLCFVGSNGLLGVETGTVSFGAVNGKSVTFRFSGDFTRYDGEGGESESTVRASGSGTATLN